MFVAIINVNKLPIFCVRSNFVVVNVTLTITIKTTTATTTNGKHNI